jgi:hypothetical protein
MKQINYSIICEDIAHSTFVDELLRFTVANNSALNFSLNTEGYNRLKFKTKSDVLNYYKIAAERWFSDYNLDLLFIIVDFDDWSLPEFTKYHGELLAELGMDIQNKSLILLPVRAIEFWLYHVQWRKDNPGSTKNISIEDTPRSEMKQKIYNTKKPHKELTEKSVRQIMSDFDPAWLNSRSASFNHFYTRFLNFV